MIPEETKYYENEYGEIVSDRIIVSDVIINPKEVIHYNSCGTNKE